VDSKAECDQLNLAHLARKQTNASSHLGLVQYRFRIREGSPRKQRTIQPLRIHFLSRPTLRYSRQRWYLLSMYRSSQLKSKHQKDSL